MPSRGPPPRLYPPAARAGAGETGRPFLHEICFLHRGQPDPGLAKAVADVKHPEFIADFDHIGIGLMFGVEGALRRWDDLLAERDDASAGRLFDLA